MIEWSKGQEEGVVPLNQIGRESFNKEDMEAMLVSQRGQIR